MDVSKADVRLASWASATLSLGFLGFELGDGGVQLGIGLDAFGMKRFGPVELPLDHLQGAFGFGQVGLGHRKSASAWSELLAVLLILEDSDQLALPDGVADVDQQPSDLPGNLWWRR